MSVFTITKFDQCCIKVMGIGWRNIFFIEYDMLNPDTTVDPTPNGPLRNVTSAYDKIQDYIDNHGIDFYHSIQSVPYWVITDGGNTGADQFAMPKLVFPQYDDDAEEFIIDTFNINICSNAQASQAAGRTLDMAFYCKYDGPYAADPAHGDALGSDDRNLWGNYMFEGTVMPFLYSDGCTIDPTDDVVAGVMFYGGNYKSDSLTPQNYRYSYMVPILAIQGSKQNPISIQLLGWAFPNPYYKQGESIEAGYRLTSFHLTTQWFDSGTFGYLLDEYLYCSDSDVALKYLTNELFISFKKFQEEIDPFDGWGPPTDEDNPSGGNGDGMLPDEVIPPTVPSVSAFNSFFTCYKLTQGELRQLANFCWSTDLWDSMKKFYTSPSDAVLGMMFVPFSPATSDSGNVYFGNIDTGVGAKIVGVQFQMKDMGSLYVPEATKSYLDFDPYLKIQIYLPFIGIKELSADDCVGKTVGVRYCNDMLSGACVAHITVNGTIRYSFSGQCGIPVPITAENLGQAMIAGATAAASVGAAVATGGASLAAGAGTGLAAGLCNASGVVGGLSSFVAAAKPSFTRSSSMGSGGGWLGPGKPFLITTYPNLCRASQQQELEGYPTFRGNTIGGFNGYTQFEAVKLKATKATQEEQEEIIKLLKAGVFL